jgi:hypothetical protein
MKKTLFFSTILAFTALFISSCAHVYTSPEAEKLIKKHKIIAIAPPKVTIAARKKVDAQAIAEQQKLESANFQKEIYSWMLRRKSQDKMFIEVLDVETTIAKLKKAGYYDDAIMTPNEMAELLEVDAVMTSNFSLTKPMSEGGAIALGVLFGVWGATNETQASIELHDRATKKLFWNYNHVVSGSIGSTPNTVVNALMRNASRKMPYFVRYK